MVQETLKAISKRPAAFPRVLATSAEKGAGMPELRAEKSSKPPSSKVVRIPKSSPDRITV